jgi:hypothetical protein
LKLKIALKLGGVIGVIGKPFGKSDLIEFISQFSELRWGRHCFFNGFCCWKIQTKCKNWFLKEKSVEPSMCSHCRIQKTILKM